MLEVINVKKRFNDKEVLKGITFHIYNGEVVSLLGENGSGKTTTFRIILNLLNADYGIINYDHKPINNSVIGYLPEERSLYHDCCVYDYLLHICKLNKMSTQLCKEKIEYWLQECKINEYANKKIAILSKGNQQKVAIIASIIKEPQLIVMDEPFTGLDSDNVEILLDIINKLAKQGKTIIISSHIYQPINDICSRYIYLKDGLISFDMKKSEMMQDNRRVIKTNEGVDFNFNCLKKIKKKNTITYIFDNEREAEKAIEILMLNSIDYTYSHIKVEDIKDL